MRSSEPRKNDAAASLPSGVAVEQSPDSQPGFPAVRAPTQLTAAWVFLTAWTGEVPLAATRLRAHRRAVLERSSSEPAPLRRQDTVSRTETARRRAGTF